GARPLGERRSVEQRDHLHERPAGRRRGPRGRPRQWEREPGRTENQKTPAQAEKPTWTVEKRR
ncbi:MAG: hypothetical protein QOG06_44, partial [Gaiellaceae bacterium]|nr:hypothetical protein [Gaiellaceae bacterium]